MPVRAYLKLRLLGVIDFYTARRIFGQAGEKLLLELFSTGAVHQQMKTSVYKLAMTGWLCWACSTPAPPVYSLDMKAADKSKATKAVKEPPPILAPSEVASAVSELRKMHLQVPIDGYDPERMKGSFYEQRGSERHEAVDMLAPRNTPVHAVCDGEIVKLFLSKPGGITIYQFDPAGKFVFYYAHLERYAEGLKEKQKVKHGDVIGYVGTSGNAPKNTPHLHLSVGVLTAAKQWWISSPIDPYAVFAKAR